LLQTLMLDGPGLSIVFVPSTETACGVTGDVSTSVSAPLCACPASKLPCSDSSGSCSDTAVQNVSTELEREAGRVWSGRVDGMRNDDGAKAPCGVGVAIIDVSAPIDGRTVSWLTDDAVVSCVDSGTLPSADEAALVTVTAVEIVSTVGDGEGARGGTASTELFTSGSFLSTGDSSSGEGERISGSG